MAANNTIVLKGRPMREEALANAAITPGHLLEYLSTGKVQKHATAGGAAYPLFAAENEVFGQAIDVAYAADDNVLMWFGYKGCEFNALVPAAAVAIVVGDKLESNGDGTLKKFGTGVILAIAMEAVNNSGGGTPARIRVKCV